jgi:hypothetical protein
MYFVSHTVYVRENASKKMDHGERCDHFEPFLEASPFRFDVICLGEPRPTPQA